MGQRTIHKKHHVGGAADQSQSVWKTLKDAQGREMSSWLRATFPSHVVTQYSSHIIHEILTSLMRKMFLLVLTNIQSSKNRPSFKFGVRDCFGELVKRHAGECKYIPNRLCDPIASGREGVTTLLDGEGETCRAAKGRQ